MSRQRGVGTGMIVSAWLALGALAGDARAQCYPGQACPPQEDATSEQTLEGEDTTPPPEGGRSPQSGRAPQAGRAAPSGGKSSFWTHNGSLVYLSAAGNRRSFYYERPREAIRAAGARPGTLLFQGSRRGNSYSGTAYIFAGRCGPMPYEVSGSVSNGDRRVTLEGRAPTGIGDDCRPSGYRRDVLVFDYSHRD